jgi:4'-phosphopantetheinyl transferase
MRDIWPNTAEPPALAADAVHVWSAPLDGELAANAELYKLLAADERERASRFRVADAKRRFVAARAALRKVLGGYLGVSPREVAFKYEANGKPRLNRAAAADLHFNLAHSGEMALIAATRGCEVGVDVERLREVNHWREIAERFFDPREVGEIDDLPPPERLGAFMRCWTAKEAVLKALGIGITRPLDFYVGSSGQPDGKWITAHEASGTSNRCRLYGLAPAVDYVGAVASLSAERTPQCFRVA